jgi:hypothetical protein
LLGVASSAAREAMLWQTSLAHGTAVRASARASGDFVRWTLAPDHPDHDACDEVAEADVGYGPGVYLPDDVPDYPRHARCRCVLAIVVSDEIEGA